MQFLELAGQSYPIRFGYGALMEYELATGKSAVQMATAGDTVGFTDILTLIACGLTNGAELAGAPREFTAKSVSRLLDETPNSPAVIQKAMALLQESFAFEDAKKKTVKMQPVKASKR